jgi:hypothetical protein
LGFHALLIVIRTVFLAGLSKAEFPCDGRLQDVPSTPRFEDCCRN